MQVWKWGLCREGGVSMVPHACTSCLHGIWRCGWGPCQIHTASKSVSHCLGDTSLAGGPTDPAGNWHLETVSAEGTGLCCFHSAPCSTTLTKTQYQYLSIRAPNKKFIGWRLLTLSDHLKRVCLFYIFNKRSKRISTKLAQPSFLPGTLTFVINLEQAFSLIEVHVHDQKTFLCASDVLHFHEHQISFIYNHAFAEVS